MTRSEVQRITRINELNLTRIDDCRSILTDIAAPPLWLSSTSTTNDAKYNEFAKYNELMIVALLSQTPLLPPSYFREQSNSFIRVIRCTNCHSFNSFIHVIRCTVIHSIRLSA